MHGFIEFKKELCDNCYKCLRVCPTKCISFNGKERNIIDDLCIKCGICQQHCPQGALVIQNSVDRVISFIKSEKKVAVSLAPSYISAFEMKDPNMIAGALKKLGFDIVEETSVGAEIVSEKYEDITKKTDLDNVITSCCPSVNYMITTQYPNLVKNILPVVSPMVAHGKYIKKRYGNDVKVVFIGPCLSKMAEANENYEAIDAVITFDNLEEWFKKEDIKLDEIVQGEFDLLGSLRGKAYPLYNKNFETDGKYKHLRVDGVENCKQVLDELDRGVLSSYSIDISMCNGSCVNGPEMPKNGEGRFEREMRLVNYIKSKMDSGFDLHFDRDVIDTTQTFKKTDFELVTPSETKIREALAKIGKYSSDDELNCGACGYSTCREKAIATCRGWSDATDCMPYLRDKAISKHALLIDNSPNSICIVDKNLEIIECNPSFREAFNKKNLKVEGIPIGYFLEDTLIQDAMLTGNNVIGKRIYNDEIEKFFIVNIILSPKKDLVFVFLNDITAVEHKKKELDKVKKETLKKTQEVIDKQMRVAQEIAGLLGETTAETKINLNSLKKLVLEDE